MSFTWWMTRQTMVYLYHGILLFSRLVTKSLSVQLFVTPWTVACQAPLSMKLSRHECWSGLPFPSPGDLPKPGIEPTSPALAGRFLITEPPRKPTKEYYSPIKKDKLLIHENNLTQCPENYAQWKKKPIPQNYVLCVYLYNSFKMTKLVA